SNRDRTRLTWQRPLARRPARRAGSRARRGCREHAHRERLRPDRHDAPSPGLALGSRSLLHSCRHRAPGPRDGLPQPDGPEPSRPRSRLALPALVRKALLEFLSDRRALTLAVVAPVLLASFTAVVMGGAGGGESGPARLAIRVADADNSELSRQIVQGLGTD